MIREDNDTRHHFLPLVLCSSQNGTTKYSVLPSRKLFKNTMASPADTLKWSAQLNVASSSRRLVGDKIALPQSALEGLLAAAPVVTLQNGQSTNLTSSFDPFNPYSYDAERQARESFADRQQQLPHPLTFRLVNPANGRAVFAGIREFSADENEVQLSSFLREALGFQDAASQISTREGTPSGDTVMTDTASDKQEVVTVHAKQLPKGTYVRLRPLEAGYDPADWKSLLERYLRDNFTTLTMNEVLNVPGGRHENFRFLVDKFEPQGEGICVVDTDLEVDIEALNEEQARETLNRRLAKAKRAPGTIEGSSAGRALQVPQEVHDQVLPGEYVDYELNQWDQSADLEVQLSTESEQLTVDLLINPISARQRSKPREYEHFFGDLSSRATKRVKLSHRNVELEEAESIVIAVHVWRAAETEQTSTPISYTLSVQERSMNAPVEQNMNSELGADEVICKNCRQHIPKRTLPLHEAFCYRNNILCPKCQNVFLKNSDTWKSHWHCPHDDDFGNGDVSHIKHNSIFHPSTPLQCPSCDFQAFDVPTLAHHRTTTCPGKEILCQFCHLVVPQQGPDDPSFTDPEVLLSGLTPHELADGARTTECHICNKIVRLRDMKTHLSLHDRERVSRPRPLICVNGICGRTIKAGDESRVHREQLSLCNECFGPLYGTAYDPEGKALRRRIERRLLQQVMGGCRKTWCQNKDYCKAGHKNISGEDLTLTAKEALPMIKPVMDQLKDGNSSGLRFCVDESSQSRRILAGILAQDGQYEVEWCIKALEEAKNNVSTAQEWLSTRAPKFNEVLR